MEESKHEITLTINGAQVPLIVDKEDLFNALVNDLFVLPDPTKIILIETMGAQNRVLVGGRPVDAKDAVMWRESVGEFMNNPVWQLLSNTVIELARQKMFNESQSVGDMRFGKALMFMVDYQKQLLARLSSLPTPSPIDKSPRY